MVADEDWRRAIALYEREVLRFAKALNLTSLRQSGALRARLIVPALAMADMVPNQGRLLDVGSGMGIPSIPILLAKPGLHGILVERRLKRAEFLRHLKRELSLDCEVHAVDVRDLPCVGADVCVARAVAKAEHLLSMCAKHMLAGGLAVLIVPRQAKQVSLPSWQFVDARFVRGADLQLVQRYRYQGVSRET